MTRFYDNTKNEEIAKAIILAEKFLSDGSRMLEELSLKNDFKYDSGSGQYIVRELLSQAPLIRVSFYRSFNPFSAALGYSDGKNIFINSRKKFSQTDLLGLLLHEYAHTCNGKFSHGNNYKTLEKCLYSVPYFISENVSKWL